MKFTKEQLNEMQKYIVGKLKMMKNHTYPSEERALTLLLLLVADSRIDNEE